MQAFPLFMLFFRAHVVPYLRESTYPADCKSVVRGCANIFIERLNIFGVSCVLPDWCGSRTEKVILQGNWLKDYVLCYRHDERPSRPVYTLDSFVPSAPFATDAEFLPDVPDVFVVEKAGKYTLHPRAAYECSLKEQDLCLNGVLNGDVSALGSDTIVAHTVLPMNLRQYGGQLSESELYSVLPFAVRPKPAADFLNFPCAMADGYVTFDLTLDTTFMLYDSLREVYAALQCEAVTCSIRSLPSPGKNVTYEYDFAYNATITAGHKNGCFYIGALSTQECLFFYGIKMYSPGKKFRVHNGHSMCGFLPPEPFSNNPVVVPRVPYVHNATHYVRDAVYEPFDKRYLCNTPIDVFSDVLDILSSVQLIFSLFRTFIVMIFHVVSEVLEASFFGLEDFTETVIILVLRVVQAALGLIFDLLLTSRLMLPLVMVAVFYYLLYLHVRDNWVVLPIVIALCVVWMSNSKISDVQ